MLIGLVKPQIQSRIALKNDPIIQFSLGVKAKNLETWE
jgi:hypothetical protein